jgi:hypothetical protein
MTEEHKHEQRPFDPADYPALREFFPAYLHQDFGEEYGSAAGAVKGFLTDATGDEILQVKEEWKALRTALRGRSFEETQRAFDQLGSSWLPENEAELQELDKLLSQAET